jgi:hypothetical protein
MQSLSRLDLIRALRERTQRLEPSVRPAPAFAGAGPPALERLLMGQGLERGTLVEWHSTSAGSGAATLALSVAGRLLEQGGALVAIDEVGELYPPALAGLGISLERTVLVRPGESPAGWASLWAWEQALRCRGVAVVLGRTPGLNDRLFHRLQLAAETGGTLGFLLRPAGQRGGVSKAAVRLRVSAQPGLHRRRFRVELLHCRGGRVGPGAAAEVEMDHETNHVRLVSELADPAPAASGVLQPGAQATG